MDNKTLSIVSYITIIGWLIAYFVGKDKADSLLKYHLRQSLGLAIFGIILNIFTITISFSGGIVINILGIFLFILMIIGIINAANKEMKPLPVIGKWMESMFNFIK